MPAFHKTFACVGRTQVAALKRLNKDTKVVLLDRYGAAARTVAKELARRGYGKVYIISGELICVCCWCMARLFEVHL